jgi:hypothetical protein
MPRDEKYVELEARIETQTAKAYLLEFTNTGEQCWVPKSQVYDRNQMGDGIWMFSISEWFVKKENLA